MKRPGRYKERSFVKERQSAPKKSATPKDQGPTLPPGYVQIGPTIRQGIATITSSTYVGHPLSEGYAERLEKAKSSIVSSPDLSITESKNIAGSNSADIWDGALASEGVPVKQRPKLREKFRLEIARTLRTKWADRFDHRDLRSLTAPAFLKIVHSVEIGEDGRVLKEVIRDIDPDLMKAVEMYVSQRNRRNNSDLGDAEGLTFVGERKQGSGRPRTPRP